MRIIEAITLMDEESGSVVIERRYTVDDLPDVAGAAPRVESIEWWGVLQLTIEQDGRPVGRKPVPFRIDARSRTEAFANLQRCMAEAYEGAKQQVQAELNQASRRQQSKILMASAAGNVVGAANGRANGRRH